MTANSPVTMQDLVDGFVLIDSGGGEWHVQHSSSVYFLENADEYRTNTISISSDGRTITFGETSESDITFASFTFNA